MQTKTNQIKHFTCNVHPSEVIQRVCLEEGVETSLKCLECILNDAENVSKDAIITVNDFLDNAVKQYQTFPKISLSEGPAPEELIDFLTQEDEKIQGFSKHIQREKENVDAVFNTMIQEFTLLCHSKRQEIIQQLDKQLFTLKFNFAYYKSKLDKYYNQSEPNNSDLDTLINRTNECQDANEMEILVKNIKDDLLLLETSLKNKKNPQLEIKESLKVLAKELQKQLNTVPKSKFTDQSDALDKFRKATNLLMEDLCENVTPPISVLSFTPILLSIDSKLVKDQRDLNLLKKWIAPDQFFRLKLLYRGSRHGMSPQMFHKRCDNYDETIIIAKSNYGKIFGGYSDQTWDCTNDCWKTSTKAWLFSLDEKQKYPIQPDQARSAIYTDPASGPCFGSGYDLRITFPTMFNKGLSSSNLGDAYEFSSQSRNVSNQNALGGANQFHVEEIEIYSIETHEEFLDSEIINPKKDLNLIKSWLGRERNYEFELIYRGTRDGFSSEDFHRQCDEKGLTLVVCRSEVCQKVFGGYTTQNWSKSAGYVADQNAFLFSLTDRTKHPVSEENHAIFCGNDSGPTFGAGPDLYICAGSDNVEDSKSILGVTYKVDENLGDLTAYLAGDRIFLIEEIEVFVVKTL